MHERGLLIKTVIVTTIVIATNLAGNYALAVGMRQVGVVEAWSPLPYIRAFADPWVAVGVLFMLAWLISRLMLLSWADLSYVLPITSFSYALSALLGAVYLKETVTGREWAGIAFITVGVALVAVTNPETTEITEEP